ncbi:hypothetical protein LTR22_019304 [Elasticomyces elasticus]|nr:hypothetical protein LTR22_019304 [Elasticomyces elasticus]KAK5751049.1 hypothetical protein LTS12_018859 [Elasticomyces elasticus]
MKYISLEPTSHSDSPGRHTWYYYHALLHSLSVLLAVIVVTLFPTFFYKPWSLPTPYSIKTAQQYLNFAATAVSILLSILMFRCLALTNDAEAEADFDARRLTPARLRARSDVSRKDVLSMLGLAINNARLWAVAAPNVGAIVVFSAISWVLSIISVLDVRLANTPIPSTVNITLGIDVPRFPDACHYSLGAPDCTYNLAASALASQLITHTPFTFANVTFSGPLGTQGLPVGALEHFANKERASRFGNERSEYCLPILKPGLVSCSPVETSDWVEYSYMSSRHDNFLKLDLDSYEVTINPATKNNQTYVLTSSHYGIMSVSRSKRPENTSVTVLTGSGQYADLLSRLSIGEPAPYTNATYNETHFTLLCEAPYTSSIYNWQWIEFTLLGGVMSATPTNITCREHNSTSRNPMAWLDYALEDATSLLNLGDGYSKLINTDYLAQSGPDFERMAAYNMSPLEYILDHIISIVDTAWTATNADTAKSTAINWRTYDHRYVISVEFTGVMIMALCVACLILLATIWQAWCWSRAVNAVQRRRTRRGADSQWQLLDPLQLLAYGSGAGEAVAKLHLHNEAERIAALRDKQITVLGSGPGTLLPVTAVEGDPFASTRELMTPSQKHSSPEQGSEWDSELQPLERDRIESTHMWNPSLR